MNHADCRQFLNQVHPLASGEVEGALALALSFHAAKCLDCDIRLTSARRVVTLLETSATQPTEPPPLLVADIMAALPPDPRVVRSRRHTWGLGVAAASVGAAIGLAIALTLSADGGPGLSPPLAGIRSALATAATYAQQFGALLTALAGKLPRLSPGPAHTAGGGTLLPGLALLSTGLLGALAAGYITAAHGLARLRQS